VLNLLDPRSPGLLAYMGADYAIVNEKMYEKGSDYSYPAKKLDLSTLPAGYQLIGQDEESALLRIISPRPDAVVLYDPKCSSGSKADMGPGLWLQFGQAWTMKIDASKDIIVDIEFSICSVQGDRDLKIDFDADKQVAEIIDDNLEKISLQGVTLKSGINDIYLSTEADQIPYNKVFGGNDSKGISFIMSFWKISPHASTSNGK